MATPATGVAEAHRKLHQRMVRAFLRDWERPSYEIANDCRASTSLAKKVRIELEEAGRIPHWRRKRKPIKAGHEASRELMANHKRTDAEIAKACGCASQTANRARKRLEVAGKIGMYRGGDNGAKQASVRIALLGNHKRPNDAIGDECNTTGATVSVVRKRMEKAGDLPRWRGTENGEAGYTYFAQAKSLRLIKIGKTVRRKRRLPLLYSQSPDEIEMLGWVRGAEIEGNLHRMLKAFVHHNEWFYPTPQVLQAIAECLANDSAIEGTE